jgi:hypothetical protein
MAALPACEHNLAQHRHEATHTHAHTHAYTHTHRPSQNEKTARGGGPMGYDLQHAFFFFTAFVCLCVLALLWRYPGALAASAVAEQTLSCCETLIGVLL